MNGIKRALKVFAAVLTIVSLTACADDPAEGTSELSAVTANSASDSTSETESISTVVKDNIPLMTYEDVREEYPDKTVLVWAVVDDGSHIRTSEINEYLSSNGCGFVVCFKPVSVLGEDLRNLTNYFPQNIEQALENGEQIDIISPMGSDELINKGMYAPLDDYLNSDSGETLYELFPEKYWSAFRVNGKIYGICGSIGYSLSLDNGYFVNSELAEKYNFDISKPISEQAETLMKAYKNESNCDVYANECPSLNILYADNVKKISDAVYWDDNSHTAKFALDNEKIVENIKCAIEFQKANLLDFNLNAPRSTFFVRPESIAGAGVVFSDNTPVEHNYYGNSVNAIPVFDTPTAIRHCDAATGICERSAHKDEAFELISLVYGDEYLNNLITFGVEGVDYTLENGAVSPIAGVGLNFVRFANDLICDRHSAMDFTAEEYRVIIDNAAIPDDIEFIFDEKKVAEQIAATDEIWNKFTDDVKNTALNKTADEAISELQKTLEEAGLHDIIDECDKQYEVFIDR